MNVADLRAAMANVPNVLIEQLERVNQGPPIHRYVQLHNSFELVVRHLAIVSYLWLQKLRCGDELLASFQEPLHRPSFQVWKNIFVGCAKVLHKERKVIRSVKDKLSGDVVPRVISYIARVSNAPTAPKRPTTTALIEAVIAYRDLTRGHGCVVHEGYEAFLGDFEDALVQLMIWWKELLDSRAEVRNGHLGLVLDDDFVDAELFLRSDAGQVLFYNRTERERQNRHFYFLNYETGLHRPYPDQAEALHREAVRLHAGPMQLDLFPITKEQFEESTDKRALERVKKHLSFNYDETDRLHAPQEAEVRALVGIQQFAEAAGANVVPFLVSRINDDLVGVQLDQAYFDFCEQRWCSLRRKEEAAIEAYLSHLSTVEVACMLKERLDGDLDGLGEVNRLAAEALRGTLAGVVGDSGEDDVVEGEEDEVEWE
jgi:hypothetical protein